MIKLEFSVDGRKITSPGQFGRELKRAAEKQVEDSLRKAAGPGVRMRKTRDGYTFEGTPDQIERMQRRLK